MAGLGAPGSGRGIGASNLHGASWVDHDVPIELVGVKCRQQEGLIARNERIGADEITRISGLPVTHRVRTAFDLGRYQPRTRAMGCLDALMRNQVFALDEVAGLSQRYPKVRGVRQLRELLPLIDAGAQSPRESLIRLQLRDAGLPRAQTQVPVRRIHAHRLPGYRLAAISGRCRIRRRPPPQGSPPVRQRPGTTAHARGAWLDRHPRNRRRIVRSMDRADDRSPAEPGLSHRDRRNAAIYSTFRCITQLWVFARPLEQTFAVL